MDEEIAQFDTQITDTEDVSERLILYKKLIEELQDRDLPRAISLCEEAVSLLQETYSEDVSLQAERLRENVAEYSMKVGENIIRVSISIGIANFVGEKDLTVETLLHRADMTMYEAKQNGRNRVYSC